MLRSMQPLMRSSRVSTAPSRARYCGNCPQTPMSAMAYGWVPPCRWQFWHVRLLPAKRLVGSDTFGPISFAVSEKSACPYLTRVPNGSSATVVISGGVHWVRSMSLFPAVARLRPPIEAVVHNIAASKKSQVSFIAHSATNLVRRSRCRLTLPATRNALPDPASSRVTIGGQTMSHNTTPFSRPRAIVYDASWLNGEWRQGADFFNTFDPEPKNLETACRSAVRG